MEEKKYRPTFAKGYPINTAEAYNEVDESLTAQHLRLRKQKTAV